MKCQYCNKEISKGREITYENEIFYCCDTKCEDKFKKDIANELKKENDKKLSDLREYYSNEVKRDRRKSNRKNSKKKISKSKCKIHKVEFDKYYYIISKNFEISDDGK